MPLSDRAIQILNLMKRGKPDDLVFPGAKRGVPLSDQALLECLRGLRSGMTVHGFRSSFRDWVGETTSYPADLAELALAHAIKNKSEAAYRRRKGLDRRRPMMADWASYLGR